MTVSTFENGDYLRIKYLYYKCILRCCHFITSEYNYSHSMYKNEMIYSHKQSKLYQTSKRLLIASGKFRNKA